MAGSSPSAPTPLSEVLVGDLSNHVHCELTMSQTSGRKYMPRPDRPVAAVRVAFDADGFEFRYWKWGAEQRAKPGDWLVDNDGDVYTVDADVFTRTYRAAKDQGPGAFVKTAPIWAARAETAGDVRTKEGSTHYEPGDYLVWNSEDDDSDRYAITADTFERLYVPVDADK